MNVSVEIKGLDKVQAYLRILPEKTKKEMGQAVEKSILVVERNAKKEAPVNKQSGGGNLRQSIKSRMTGQLSGEVTADSKYAGFVEEGTSPHIITIARKRVLADRRAGKIFGTTVQHPGTRANPFFKRGVESSVGRIQAFFSKALSAIIKS